MSLEFYIFSVLVSSVFILYWNSEINDLTLCEKVQSFIAAIFPVFNISVVLIVCAGSAINRFKRINNKHLLKLKYFRITK